MMRDKTLILVTTFSFGFSCLVIGQMLWNVIHYWGTWKVWMFGGLGLLNIVTTALMVRSHLRWFDTRVSAEYHKGRMSGAYEIWKRLRDESDVIVVEEE